MKTPSTSGAQVSATQNADHVGQGLDHVGWFKPYDGPYAEVHGPWVFIPLDGGEPGPGWQPAFTPRVSPIGRSEP